MIVECCTRMPTTEEEYWCAVALEFTAPDTYNVERARGWVVRYSAIEYGTGDRPDSRLRYGLYTIERARYTNSGSETSKSNKFPQPRCPLYDIIDDITKSPPSARLPSSDAAPR